MSEEQEIIEFEIKNEPVWLSPLGWGAIYGITVIMLEFFLLNTESTPKTSTHFFEIRE